MTRMAADKKDEIIPGAPGLSALTIPARRDGARVIRGAAAPVLCLLLGGLLAACVAGTNEQPDEKADEAKAQSAARLKELTQHVKSVTVSVRENDKDRKVDPLDEPLLRYSDPARYLIDAAVWAFGSKGRPAALVTVERYPKVWSFELASLAADVSAVAPDGWKWNPLRPALEMHELADAPAPADSAAARLRQMRGQMNRFSAYETDPGEQRFELRLLTQPVHRYADADAGLIDGAMFAFSYGTNPEVFVVFECRAAAEGKRAWSYGCVPSSSNRAVVSLDGKEVWSKPLTGAAKTPTPYANFVERVEE